MMRRVLLLPCSWLLLAISSSGCRCAQPPPPETSGPSASSGLSRSPAFEMGLGEGEAEEAADGGVVLDETESRIATAPVLAQSMAPVDDGFPRAAAFDEDEDEDDNGEEGEGEGEEEGDGAGAESDDEQQDRDAGPADAGSVEDAIDAGPVHEVLPAAPDAGPLDAGPVDAGVADEPAATAVAEEEPPPPDPLTLDEWVLRTNPNQSQDPVELQLTQQLRAAIGSDSTLSEQTRASTRIATKNGIIRLQGEVPTERERSEVQDRVEALAGDDFSVNNMLIVRDRGFASPAPRAP